VREKLLFMVTHGPREPELATIPFVMAAAALASEVDVVMGFQADGVELMEGGVAGTVAAPEFPPLAKLLGDVQEMGGTFLACSPCLKNRAIGTDRLIDGVEVVAAGRFIVEITSSNHVLNY
jgi:uncharacterized protein